MNSDFDELLRLFNASRVRYGLVGRSPRTAADALVGPFAPFEYDPRRAGPNSGVGIDQLKDFSEAARSTS